MILGMGVSQGGFRQKGLGASRFRNHFIFTWQNDHFNLFVHELDLASLDHTQLLVLGSDELRVLRVDLVELASALLPGFVQSFD